MLQYFPIMLKLHHPVCCKYFPRKYHLNCAFRESNASINILSENAVTVLLENIDLLLLLPSQGAVIHVIIQFHCTLRKIFSFSLFDYIYYNAQKLCLRIMLALLCSMFCLPIKYALNYAGTVYNWCRPNTCKTFLQCLTLDGIRNINTCD